MLKHFLFKKKKKNPLPVGPTWRHDNQGRQCNGKGLDIDEVTMRHQLNQMTLDSSMHELFSGCLGLGWFGGLGFAQGGCRP